MLSMEEYIFKHRASVKARWFGRKLVDVLVEEFPYRNEAYFNEAIKLGVVTVNNTKVSPYYLLKGEDIISHEIHKHEPKDVIISFSDDFKENIKQISCLKEDELKTLHENINNLQRDSISDGKKLEIIAITSDFIVINKPYGVASHPTGGYVKYSITEILYDTVFKGIRNEEYVNWLKELRIKLIEENRKKYNKCVNEKIINLKKELECVFKLGCINRLDVVTTGVMVLSFNDASRHHKNIGNTLTKKTYLAKTKGDFSKYMSTDSIKNSWDLFLNNLNLKEYHESINYEKYMSYYVCSENINKIGAKMSISEDGKSCITLFKLWKTNNKYTIVECIPVTGRTHQIRVHLAYLNCPIINDPFYGTMNLSLINENNITCKKISNIEKDMFIYENCEGGNGTAWRNRKYFICLHALTYKLDGISYSSKLPEWAYLNE